MAKKVNSIFLIIEAPANDFLNIGFGAGGEISASYITEGIFAGFSQITVKGGGFMVCDDCNAEIEQDEVCYYVAVLNRVLCKDCFDKWVARAKYYQEDAPFEERNYNRTKAELEAQGLWSE